MKLYEITGALARLDSMELETADDIQAYGDLYNGLQCNLRDKIHAGCMVIRNADAEIDSIKAEVDRLTARKKIIENRTVWLKGYMQTNLDEMGIDKVDTDLFSVCIQANPPSVDVRCGVDDLDDEYKIVKVEIDKTAIKEALKSGIIIDGCTLSQSKSLRIK